MKKIALGVVFAIIFCISSIAVFSGGIEMPLRVVINSNKLTFPDAQPFIDSNNRTQTPARFIGEALGAKVTWVAILKKAIFEKDGKKLVLYLGKKEYELNGQKMQMDTEAILKEDRTFVPARYVAEAFGATVEWDNAVRTVYIKTGSVLTAVPTSTPTKDPVTGWITVQQGGDAEYAQTIVISSDASLREARYDAAEKMFIQRYGREDIARQIYDYARTKVSDSTKINKRFQMDNKYIDVFGGDISVEVMVWKEGVIQ